MTTHMLSKQKAEEAAQAVVAAEKAEVDAIREKRARGAPIGLRIPGLQALPKRVQDTLVREAFAAARTSYSARASAAIWGLICLIGWLMARPYINGSAPLAVALAVSGVSIILTVSTRKELTERFAAFKLRNHSRAA